MKFKERYNENLKQIKNFFINNTNVILKEEEDLTVVNISRTQKGYPAVWEKGGALTNSGKSQVVTGPRGERLAPIFVRTKGHLANEEHALFIVRPGYFVVRAGWHRNEIWVFIVKLESFENDKAKASTVVDWEGTMEDFNSGKHSIPPQFIEAAKAALKKSQEYHCRRPFYFEPRRETNNTPMEKH